MPESTTDASAPDDGSPQFLGSGVLVAVMSNDIALQSFDGISKGVEADGAEESEVAAVQAAVEDGDLVAALEALAKVDLHTETVRIEALPEVGEDAVWLRFTERGERGAVFMRSLPDGRLLQIMVVRADLSEAKASDVEEIDAAMREVAMDETADYLRNALTAEGWQESTDEDTLSFSDENFQTYTFVQYGIQLMVVQTKNDNVNVTYNILLLASDEPALTENTETTPEPSSTEEQTTEEPATEEEVAEPLTVEEVDDRPLPSDQTGYSSEGSKFFRVLQAASPSSLPILVEFFSTELPTRGWQRVEETPVSDESKTFTARYEGAAGRLELTLTAGDEETQIQIVTRDSAAAAQADILPAKGKARIYFVNAGEKEITMTIGKETITLSPDTGMESPTDAPHLDVAPKTYQVTIRLGDDKTAGEEVVSEVTLAADEVWMVASDGEFEFVTQIF